jgi:hypothetical protein
MHGIGEKGDEGERVASVADHAHALASRGGAGDFGDSEEAQVDPRSEKAEQRQPHGGIRAQKGTRYHICQNEDGREVLDAHSDHSFEERNGMFGDQLFQRD